MAKSKTKVNAKGKVLTLPITFGNVSIGDGTFRLGFSTERKAISFGNVEKLLCGKRVTGKLIARAGDADPEQPSFDSFDNDASLAGSFDVKSIGMTPKRWSGGFTFNSESADGDDLKHFPKRRGLLVIDGTEALPEKKRGRPPGDDADKPEPEEDEDADKTAKEAE